MSTNNTPANINQEIIFLAATAPNKTTVKNIPTNKLQELEAMMNKVIDKLMDMCHIGAAEKFITSIEAIEAELATR